MWDPDYTTDQEVTFGNIFHFEGSNENTIGFSFCILLFVLNRALNLMLFRNKWVLMVKVKQIRSHLQGLTDV